MRDTSNHFYFSVFTIQLIVFSIADSKLIGSNPLNKDLSNFGLLSEWSMSPFLLLSCVTLKFGNFNLSNLITAFKEILFPKAKLMGYG